VVIVKPAGLSVSVTATGDLLPNEQVDLRAPVEGNVVAIHFSEGEYVQKNSVLLEIDDRTWKARLQGLEAQLVSARNDLERKRGLINIEGTSREELDQAEATVQNLKAQIDELKVTIDLSRVKAPFSGRIGMRNFSPGAYLSKGDPIATITQTDPVKVNFTIPARYANQVKVGNIVFVNSSTSADTTTARIYAIDPVISESDRSLQLRAILKNPEMKYIPGDFAEVTLRVDQNADALLIPAEAVIPELNTHVVYAVKNNIAVRQNITVGVRTETQVQVLSGLSAGDTVMVTGLLEISDGQKVEVGKVNQSGAL